MWTGRRLASILPFPTKIHVESSRPFIMSVCVLAYATLYCLQYLQSLKFLKILGIFYFIFFFIFSWLKAF